MRKRPASSGDGTSLPGDKTDRQKVGAFGEQAAVELLRRAGYRIIERNHRSPLGEVDIIAQDGKTLVFVEVRTRKSAGYGTAAESITRHKQDKLRQLAESYVQALGNPNISYRIDVVVVQLRADGQVERIELIRNAVEDAG